MVKDGFSVKKGQVFPLPYEGREFQVIVIDPNGLGKGQPSVGLGFSMADKYIGLPDSTLSSWVIEKPCFEGLRSENKKCLKVPSGNLYKVSEILGTDNNLYFVLEVAEWVTLIVDVLDKPGNVRKPTQRKLINFLSWFAVKGLYADAYAYLKGKYTQADSRAVSAWLMARLEGIAHRNNYTAFLQANGCEDGWEYGKWTNYIYLGLFGIKKENMLEHWELVEGNKNVGRNHIPEIEGLEAVAYCERQVIELFHSSLQQAHDDAISFAKRKFKLEF